MGETTIFISYSHRDEEWKDRLSPHLKMLEEEGRVAVWDDRKIDQGDEWYPEIKAAMEKASVAVCLISADYLTSDFCKKEEIPYLLERRERDGMALLPILVRPCFWETAGWLKKIQMLPRDGKAVFEHKENEWDAIFTGVARKIAAIFNDPDYKPPPPPPPEWSPPERVDILCLPMTGAELFGRKKELERLDKAWDSGDDSVVSLVAWGGVGKSTLVNKWLEKMAEDNYRGARKVFAWSFYSQGTGERVTSADHFIREALEWFGDTDPDAGSAWNKGKRLAALIQKEKTLLILDGLEPLQSPHEFERGKMKDPALEMLITGLAKNNPGLCVITTRERLAGMKRYGASVRQMDLERISVEAGRALLRVAGVRGTDEELENATRSFGAHALALNLLAQYLRGIQGHHISSAYDIPDLDISEETGKHPRRIMEAFENRFGKGPETEVLRMLGLFDRPTEKGALDAIQKGDAIPGLTESIHGFQEAGWLHLLEVLRETGLVARKSRHRPDAVDCHPLMREHFGQKLRDNHPEAWKEAHGRLYDYYKNLPEKKLPDTLEEMEPLFAAVAHGCQAGRHQETLIDVYWERISRKEYFSLKKLGAFGSDLGALSGFFEVIWSRPVSGLTAGDKAGVLGWAGFCLRALGRLREAVQPMQAGLEARIEKKKWKNAAMASGNLSQLYLTLGDVKQALDYAQRSVNFADQSGDAFSISTSRSSLADVLHQAGELSEAEKLFQKAEAMQKERRPGSPFLYSLRGFQFCDFLLSQGKYREVEKRIKKLFEWRLPSDSLLDSSLENLSLGRAYLLQALEEETQDFTLAEHWLNQSVEGLREAGELEFISRGLHARSNLFRVMQEFSMAWSDIEEALEIVEFGGMGLQLADYHLEAARLHLAQGNQYQARENLEKAKSMVDDMGYHRRDGEIEELRRRIRMGRI